MRSRVDVN